MIKRFFGILTTFMVYAYAMDSGAEYTSIDSITPPITLTKPGTYKLINSIMLTPEDITPLVSVELPSGHSAKEQSWHSGIIVAANDVVLDLGGNSIIGTSSNKTPAITIKATTKRVKICNGIIQGLTSATAIFVEPRDTQALRSPMPDIIIEEMTFKNDMNAILTKQPHLIALLYCTLNDCKIHVPACDS
jgi:hypothetical protein